MSRPPSTPAWEPEYLEKAVLTKWHVAALDTLAIAKHYGIDEPEVCRIIARAQDRRHVRKQVAV